MLSKNISETFTFEPDAKSAENLLHEYEVEATTSFVMYEATVLEKVILKSEGRLRWTLLTRGNVKWRDAGV